MDNGVHNISSTMPEVFANLVLVTKVPSRIVCNNLNGEGTI